MTEHNWKPGDVATTGGDSLITFHQDRDSGELMFTNAYGFRHPVRHLAREARPLVVIDPEDREQVERLHTLWCEAIVSKGTSSRQIDSMQAALREFAAPTPPRIKEPDVWGVVRAGCVHSDQVRTWMRHEEDGNWYVVGTDTKNNPDDWDSLTNPVLVREGVVA